MPQLLIGPVSNSGKGGLRYILQRGLVRWQIAPLELDGGVANELLGREILEEFPFAVEEAESLGLALAGFLSDRQIVCHFREHEWPVFGRTKFGRVVAVSYIDKIRIRPLVNLDLFLQKLRINREIAEQIGRTLLHSLFYLFSEFRKGNIGVHFAPGGDKGLNQGF